MSELGLLRTPAATAALRRAGLEDVPSIVELLTDDPLGAARDGTDGAEGFQPYVRAFEAIDADPAHLLLVAEADGQVVATIQLSFLSRARSPRGLRGQIEAVRVDADLRGSGLGRAMVTWAIAEAQRRGCALVQLTSDKQRPEAHRFYSRLGFVASHEGFKLALQPVARTRAWASRTRRLPGYRRAGLGWRGGDARVVVAALQRRAGHRFEELAQLGPGSALRGRRR